MQVPLPCPEPADLERLLLGAMPEVEMDVLEGHISACVHCLRAIRGLRNEDALVAAVRDGGRIGRLPREEVDDVLIARLCSLRRDSNALPAPSGGTPLPDALLALEKAGDVPRLLAPPGAPDELGRIGSYGILRVLGSGGMGIVFAARQDRPRRVVALKMILAGLRTGRNRLERFRRESEILARLRHVHIVQVHEVGEHEGQAFFTMDYAAGGSLAQRLATASLPPRRAAELVQMLARAVDSAHEQGIVHRDLKPSNVLLTADDTPLIGDFGLAKQLEGDGEPSRPGDREDARPDPTETGAILGTPSYMAPEQAGGPSTAIGPAADVYALGAILYECLTGRPPFKAATVLETLEQLRHQEPVPLVRLQPGLPRDLQTICLKCLQKDSRRRYASARALADDLERFLGGRPITARPVRAWERAWKWARRKPAVAALAAVSLIVALAIPIALAVHSVQLEQALAETQKQQQRADANYGAARDSMGKMLDRLNAKRLADVPRLKELRQELLEDTLAFYQTVLKQADNADPAVRQDAAFALAETGAIQLTLGRSDPAQANLERAIIMLGELPADFRDRPECRNKLALCHNYLGTLALNTQKWEECERQYGKVHTIFERLAGEYPDSAQWQNELGRVDHQRGHLYQAMWRLPEAQTHYERAIVRRTKLRTDHGDVEEYQAQLAQSHLNLGWLFAQQKRLPEGQAESEKAIELLEPLQRKHSEDFDYALSLAAACGNLGQFLDQAGKLRDAEKQLTRAVALAEAVLRLEPQLEHAQSPALNTHGMRAQLYEKMWRWADAVKDWDRVVALDREPTPWLHRALRALALARAGDHARAASEALILEKEPQVPPEGLAALASVYALSIGPARKDAALPKAERDALAEKHAASALALLHKLHAQGYFQDAGHARELVTDLDLAALRSRPDFEKLRKQVEAEKAKSP